MTQANEKYFIVDAKTCLLSSAYIFENVFQSNFLTKNFNACNNLVTNLRPTLNFDCIPLRSTHFFFCFLPLRAI